MRELISARLGDMLANLYLTMVLKGWHEFQPVDGEELMQYSLAYLLHRTELALDESSEPRNRPVALALRAITLPLGCRWDAPHDDLARKLARSITTDTPVATS